MPPLYQIDENGNVVTPQGTIPAAFARAAELNLGPSADLSIPAQPEPVPYQILPDQPAVEAPLPASAETLDVAPLVPPAPPIVMPEGPQAELPPVQYAEDLPFEQRVDRTFQQNSSLGGIAHARAEGMERGTELGSNAAHLKAGADRSDAQAEGTYHADAAAINSAGADFAREAVAQLNEQQADVLKRSAEIREELDNTQIDPNRVFRKQGLWGNIADTIAVAFGAMAQFSTGRNVALELVRKKVEDDMASQETRRGQLERQFTRLPDQLQAVRSAYDNTVAADALERAFKFKAIEDKLRAQLAAAKGTRAEAGLQAALFEVNNWRMEQLDKAEKAQMAWVSLQAQAMAKGAKAGAAGPQVNKEARNVPTGQVVDTSSGKSEIPDLSWMSAPERAEYSRFTSDAQRLGNAAATIQDMNTEFKVRGANKAYLAQQVYGIYLDGMGAVKGAASEKDALVAAQASGIGDGTADGFVAYVMGRDGDVVKNMVAQMALTKRENAMTVLNQNPYGKRYAWEGFTPQKAEITLGAAREGAKPAEQKVAEAYNKLRVDLKAGEVPNPLNVDLRGYDNAQLITLKKAAMAHVAKQGPAKDAVAQERGKNQRGYYLQFIQSIDQTLKKRDKEGKPVEEGDTYKDAPQRFNFAPKI
jgi:hypothetical protein